MAEDVIFTGDSFPLVINLKSGTTVEPIPTGATVTAGLVSTSKDRTLLAGPWTVSSATPGSQWSQGVAVVNVVGADTEGIEPQAALIETQVVSGSTRLTYQSRVRVKVRRGSLP